jgi:AraC-like DNA-binding protein
MNNRQPKLMDMMRMKDIFMPYLEQIREHVYFSNEIGILHGNPKVFRLIIQQKPPFVINDYRLGFIVCGEGHVNFNLVDRHIKAGTLIFLAPGTIINPISFSDDLEIFGFALFADFPMPFGSGQMPLAFNGQVRDFQLSASDADIQTARNIFDTLWHLVHQPNYHRPTATSLVAAMMHHYNALYNRYTEQQSTIRSREQTIFDRFIQLVNQHCAEQHQISYYADRLCLTERYLGTVIRQTSGVTAKEWIDRALITRIKVELMHTDKPVARIADDLSFPNPSFFSKYFKRLVGITPGEYRMG